MGESIRRAESWRVRQGYKVGFPGEGLPRLSLEGSIGSGQAEDGEGRKDDIG